MQWIIQPLAEEETVHDLVSAQGALGFCGCWHVCYAL